MNDVVDTELVQRLRSHYGGAVRDPDLSKIRARAHHLERRRRRAVFAATAVAAASASALTIALVSFDGDDHARLSTEVPSSSVTDSTSIATSTAATVTTNPATAAETARPHNQVKVFVANGSGRDSYATNMHQNLVTLGYSSLGAENARPLPLPTVIYYRDGYREDAKQLARTIGAPETLIQPTNDSFGDRLDPPVVLRAQTANVVIILGNETTPFVATSSTTTPSRIPGINPATTTRPAE
jgi:hypothetical protein